MAKLRGLVIGCGSMGARRAAVMRAEGWVVDALDTDAGRAAKVGNVITSTAPSLLPAPYNAVVIATPPDTHVDYARTLIRQGVAKGILIEKPLALDLGLTESLIEEAERAGVVTMMGQTLRWHRDLRELSKVLHHGDLGGVIHVSAWFGHRLELWGHPDPVNTYVNGVLIDAATHELDLVLWLAGADAEWLIADAWRSGLYEMEHEDIADITLGLTNGARATVHVDLADVTYRRRITVIGGKNTAEWSWRPDDDMYERETIAFLAAVTGAERPPDWPDLRAGRRVLALALGARQSGGRTLLV